MECHGGKVIQDFTHSYMAFNADICECAIFITAAALWLIVTEDRVDMLGFLLFLVGLGFFLDFRLVLSMRIFLLLSVRIIMNQFL